MTAETSNARGEWVLVPREPTEAMISHGEEWEYSTISNGPAMARQLYAAMLAAAPQPPAEAQPVAWQFQGRDGEWHGFVDERHRQNTIADGSWPVRALYAAPPSAPVGVEASYHPCTSILIEGVKRLEGGGDVLAEWDRARAKADAAIAQQSADVVADDTRGRAK